MIVMVTCSILVYIFYNLLPILVYPAEAAPLPDTTTPTTQPTVASTFTQPTEIPTEPPKQVTSKQKIV